MLRTRLSGTARELARRAEALNAARQEVFGSTELRLAGAERLRTARPALPADIAPVGPYLLFAANPADVEDVADVFRVRRADDLDGDGTGAGAAGADTAASTAPDTGPAGLLDDPGFVRDFHELYRYYRQTRVVRVRVWEGRVLAVFRTGAGPDDVKALGWRIGRDGRCAYEGTAREEPAEPPETVRWSAVGREAYVPGRRPHIALTAPDGGTLTLDTTGGALTLRTGGAVHEEPVDDALQSLADADVALAGAGPLVLLRVRPYRESADRHFAVNTRTEQIERIDALGQVCLRLPDDQGVVFPGGYVLATGGTRTFDLADLAGRAEPAGDPGTPPAAGEAAATRLEFERAVRSANGEDVLYVFHAPADGHRLLLPYNLIRKEAAAPLHVQGSALYEDGTLITLRPAEGGEPGRVHTLQRWHTPFLSDTYAAARPVGDGPLARIGNPDLVRAVSDALSVARAALEPEPAAAVYEALTAAAERVLDRHHWLADPAAQDLAGPLTEVRDTARQVLAEYARVRESAARAAAAADEAEARITALGRRVRGEAAASADEWVTRLTELRGAQGRLATLREMRQADPARLDALDALLARELAEAAARAAAHFADEAAFDGYRQRVADVAARVPRAATAADTAPLAAALDEQAAGLATVTETAGTLEITDATVRTRILATAADVLGAVNHARAVLASRRRELLAAETGAEFAAQSALLAQSIGAALDAAGTPEACEEQLGRLLVQIENLATRFAADEERLAALDARREEVRETFAARKQALADERAQRAQRLTASAARLLDGIRRRAATPAPPTRSTPTSPRTRSPPNTAGSPRSCARSATPRGPRNSAPRSPPPARPPSAPCATGSTCTRTAAPRSGWAGTASRSTPSPSTSRSSRTPTASPSPSPAPTTSPRWTTPPSRPPAPSGPGHWSRSPRGCPGRSSSPAGCCWTSSPRAPRPPATCPRGYGRPSPSARRKGTSGGARPRRGAAPHGARRTCRARRVVAVLRRHPGGRPALLDLRQPACRTRRVDGAGPLAQPGADHVRRGRAGRALDALATELGSAARDFLLAAGLPEPVRPAPDSATDALLLGEYLVAELAAEQAGFAVGPGARTVVARLTEALGGPDAVPYKEFSADLDALGGESDAGLGARWQLARAWLGPFAGEADSADGTDGAEGPGAGDLVEAAAGLVCGAGAVRYEVDAEVEVTVRGLLAAHPRAVDGAMTLRVDELLTRVRRFTAEEVPAYRAYQRHRTAVVAAERDRLALDGYRARPRPASSATGCWTRCTCRWSATAWTSSSARPAAC